LLYVDVYFRGVIQTLVEKHFPAPDQRKFFEAFGLGNNSIYNNEDSNSSLAGGNKRKRGNEKLVFIIFFKE